MISWRMGQEKLINLQQGSKRSLRVLLYVSSRRALRMVVPTLVCRLVKLLLFTQGSMMREGIFHLLVWDARS